MQTKAARRVCRKRQRGEDLGKSDARTVFRGQNHLVAAIFAKAGLNRIGHRERRIIHRGDSVISEMPDIACQLDGDGRLVRIFHAGGGPGQRRWIGGDQLRCHFMRHHDDMCHAVRKLVRRLAEIAHIHPCRVMPAKVDLGNADKIGTEPLCDGLDRPALLGRGAKRRGVRRDWHGGLDQRLKPFAQPAVAAAFRDHVGYHPGRVSGRQSHAV